MTGRWPSLLEVARCGTRDRQPSLLRSRPDHDLGLAAESVDWLDGAKGRRPQPEIGPHGNRLTFEREVKHNPFGAPKRDRPLLGPDRSAAMAHRRHTRANEINVNQLRCQT
jgi:hypothetical protein